jgi:murein DD-endopeptidase MepM/ murein hydrolase activator NlpD
MAGIDAREFDFSHRPGVGGPASADGAENFIEHDVLATLTALDKQVAHQSEQLAALESLHIDREIDAAVTPSGWPVHGGWVSSGFGHRVDPFTGRKSMHQGVDIASPLGSPIRAMGDGFVTYAGFKTGYGLMVELNHGNGLRTRYAHATALVVALGDRIAKGDTVATVGTSGRSTGPHLHFEVLHKNRYIDPASFLDRTETTVARRSGTPRG